MNRRCAVMKGTFCLGLGREPSNEPEVGLKRSKFFASSVAARFFLEHKKHDTSKFSLPRQRLCQNSLFLCSFVFVDRLPSREERSTRITGIKYQTKLEFKRIPVCTFGLSRVPQTAVWVSLFVQRSPAIFLNCLFSPIFADDLNSSPHPSRSLMADQRLPDR